MTKEIKRTKIQTVQLEGKVVEYTHKFIPNSVNIKLNWKQIIKLVLKRKIVLELNVYMNNDKIVHIIGSSN